MKVDGCHNLKRKWMKKKKSFQVEEIVVDSEEKGKENLMEKVEDEEWEYLEKGNEGVMVNKNWLHHR